MTTPVPNRTHLCNPLARPSSARRGAVGLTVIDLAYRERDSLLRYYPNQPGRDVRVQVGCDL